MFSQIDVFHDCFEQIDDPRVAGRTTHPLHSILLLVVAAMIADADGPEETEDFGKERIDWLSPFADFSNGIPSHDTIGRVMSMIAPKQFQQALIDWHTRLIEAYQNAEQSASNDNGLIHIAIDGKTSRGSYTTADKSDALHFVSAWATKHGIALGQTEVASKSNEITAIDELLDFLDVRQSVITLDAIGAQKTIAAKIFQGGGDYVFAIKDNHPKLATAIRKHFELVHEEDLKKHRVKSKQTVDHRGCRREERFYAVCSIPESLRSLTKHWAGAKSIGQAITQIEEAGQCRVEVRYFLLSCDSKVGQFAISVRSHWQIESMHWVLDVAFHDDDSRIRTRNATANFTFIRRFILSLLKQDTSNHSLKRKRKLAGWNVDFHETLLF